MLHDALHQPLPQPAPTIRFQHKQVADVTISRAVRDYARKAHLLPVTIHSKAKRIFDGVGHNLTRDSPSPVTFRQKTVEQVQIQMFAIRTDDELCLAVFYDLFHAGFHFAILT
jgi:hypothetical protein